MSTILQLLYSVIIGIIQGVSEWLPISSKTQIIVSSSYLLKLKSFQEAYTFGLFMEIGTIIAAVVYFRKELIEVLQVLLGSKNEAYRKLLVYVVVVTVITGIIGAPLYLVTESVKGISLGIPMLIVGLVLLADAAFIRYSRKRREKGINSRKLENLSLGDYLLIGIAQGISALPGVSRSGITTSAMLLMNVEPDEAFRLSFFAGIFASIGAFGLTLVTTRSNVAAAVAVIGLPGLIVAIVVATVVSLFLIDFLIKVAGKSKIIYLISALGIIAMASGLLYLAIGL
ncbi:MAG TPA: undecaprenyl-diphosphate phosphatase [Candidatus Acidoferrales bacterium]|nr:undecaprenyl-diphosphate phosphatase [Candidatus Acidoferrales bacterium]